MNVYTVQEILIYKKMKTFVNICSGKGAAYFFTMWTFDPFDEKVMWNEIKHSKNFL